MDDIFSKINELLKNPEAVEQIKSIASGVSGNTGEDDSKTVFAQENDAQSVSALKNILNGAASQDKNIALLNAIAPYMRRERAAKINSAVKAIQVLSILNMLR